MRASERTNNSRAGTAEQCSRVGAAERCTGGLLLLLDAERLQQYHLISIIIISASSSPRLHMSAENEEDK